MTNITDLMTGLCVKKERRELNDIFEVKAKELKAVIDSLCDEILDAFKLFFGISSPSKEWLKHIIGGK